MRLLYSSRPNRESLMVYGYLRVSPDSPAEQTRQQRLALMAVGCNKILEEVSGGPDVTLRALLNSLQAGDVIAVTRLDRLATNIRDLQRIVHEVHERRATLKVTEE